MGPNCTGRSASSCAPQVSSERRPAAGASPGPAAARRAASGPKRQSWERRCVSSPRAAERIYIKDGVMRDGRPRPRHRRLKFRATVRDNRSGGGAASSDEMQVNVRADAGPFTVNQPVNWSSNSVQTVTWNVANTNNAPVSCDTVRITLSRDDGSSFPMILANSTPNDGSETVTVPGSAGACFRAS